jgi:oligopeptide transport system substrate-binding protein
MKGVLRMTVSLKFFYKAAISLIFISLFSFSIFCTKNSKNSSTNQSKTILNFGNQTEPQDLDPQITTGIPEFHIYEALFEGLINLKPDDLSPIPGVATHWEMSKDRLTWTFFLRSDARWSNGDTLKAKDFVFAFKRILSPALASEYSYMLYCLKNAERFNKGTCKDFSLVGVKAVNDTTIELHLEKVVPYLLSLIAHHSWFPVHEKTILKHGPLDTRGTQWTRPGNFVGNGPFSLTDWQVNKIIKVTKNPFYWDSAVVRLEEINFYPIEDHQTEERMFQTNQLHITSNCPLSKINYYKSNKSELLRIDPQLGTYYYLLNVNKKPFDNSKIRKALALSVNRKEITDYVLKGGQLPTTGFVPPGTGGYNSDSLIGFDTIQAKKLLKEAGITDPSAFPEVSLLYNTSEAHHTVAQAIQQMWKKYLGITVTLVNQEWKVYLANTQKKEYEIARMGWIGDYNDPTTFLDMWITDGGNNRTGWSNRTYDSLINKASFTTNISERISLFKEAEKILMDELPIIPIYYYTNVYLIQTSVKGYVPNILNLRNFKFVYLE